MVNRDGTVRKWQEDLPLSEVKAGAITSETLNKLSPMAEPDDSPRRIAQTLLKTQRENIQVALRIRHSSCSEFLALVFPFIALIGCVLPRRRR